MAKFVAKNVVKETSTTTGTGTYVLAGAVTGYDPFSVVGAGSKVAYKAEDAAGTTKEVGIGTVSISPNQLTRDEILRSPSGSAVNWGAGTKTIILVGPAELLKVSAIAPGPFNCRLAFVSTTQIALQREQGANLPLVSSGVWRDREIPSAGVTLGNATMAASTVYNIYAFWNVSAIGLEFSTTAHVADADTGIEIKTGDSTRLLVGKVRTNASSQFADSDVQRFVLSWFNKRPIRGKAVHASNAATNSGTPVELSTGRRVEFLTWAGHSVAAEVQSRAETDVAGQGTDLRIAFDGALQGNAAFCTHVAVGGAQSLSVASNINTLAEGYHYVTPFAAVTGGTSTFTANYNVTTCEVQG